MRDAKGRYGFSSWPAESAIEEDGIPASCRLDEEAGFKLLERRPLLGPKSYEDVYQDRENLETRISVKVIHCKSFEEAKEQLAGQLSQCAAPTLPRVTDQLNAFSADIAFGAADGSGKAIFAVRGKTVILVRNIGRREIDLFPVYEMLHEKIRLLNCTDPS